MNDHAERQMDRVTALAGFSFVGLIIPGVVFEVIQNVDQSQSPAEITRHLGDSATLTYIGGGFLLAATLAYLLFACGLARLIRQAGYSLQGDFAIVSAGMGLALGMVYIAGWEATTAAVPQLHNNPAVISGMYQVINGVDASSNLPLGAFTGAVAWYLWRCGILGSKSRWLGVISGVLTCVSVLSVAKPLRAFFIPGIVGFLMELVWIAIVSTVLLRRRTETPAAAVAIAGATR